MQKLRRQDLILLTGLSLFACVSVITVGLLILRFQSVRESPVATAAVVSQPQVQPIHTVTFVDVTGLGQFPEAEIKAEDWANDAQLISANASWPRVLSQDQVGEPGQWTYRFYSPGKERLLIAKVEPDGRVRTVEHVVRVTVPPPALSSETWLIDSPTALATWLDYGGADLVKRNPGLEVLVQLRTVGNHDGPVWMVVGTDKRTQDIHVVLVDANLGVVIPTDPAR